MARQVPLTQGQHALVDDEDYDRVMQHKWHAQRERSGKFYAKRTVRDRALPLANFVLDVPRGTLVDHINRDTLDNTRANLRVATPTVNARNRVKAIGDYTSRHVGVNYDTHGKRWCATISVGCRQRRQRYFKTEAEALAQRKAWEQQYYASDDA